MCVRINNIHTVINIFVALEDHLYSCMRTAVPKPISAFGYVSSDPGELSPRPMTDKSLVSNPHHTIPENETTSEGPTSVRDAHRGMQLLTERLSREMFLIVEISSRFHNSIRLAPTLWLNSCACVCIVRVVALTYNSRVCLYQIAGNFQGI